MVGQIMEQVPFMQPGQKSSSQRAAQEGSAGFDEMLQQKRQVTGESTGNQSGQPVRRKDEPAAKTAEAGQPRPETDEELPDDAKAVLAAMMVQPQPQMQLVTETAEAEPELVSAPVTEAAETVLPEAAETVAEAPELPEMAEAAPETQAEAVETPVYAETAAQAAPETAEAEPQRIETDRQAPAQQTRETPAQAEEQPRQQELQQEETVERAPETAQAQPRQVRRQAEQSPEAQASTENTRQTDDETPAEAPLFQPETVEQSVPVKVAEPEHILNREQPLPIESAEAPRQLADIMVTGMEDGRQVSIIRIDPENLGPVRMTISREADGTVHMALEAANPRTQALLEKHANSVQNIVAANLHEDVRVEVRQNDRSEQQDWTDGRERQDRQPDGQRRGQKDERTDDEFVQRLRLGLIRTADEDDDE